jgi:hypothetical protein
MEKFILHNRLAPGDVAVMTAAVKAVQDANPGRFQFDYRGTGSELWWFNPYLTPLDPAAEDVHNLQTNYTNGIGSSNQRPRHFIEGYTQFFKEKFGVKAPVNHFHPDIYINDEEKSWISQVEEITRVNHPYWILVAGGKFDYTIKWWDYRRFQKVVNKLRGKVCFVRVGQTNDYHPPIDGVIDLKGRTDLRQLIRLVYHSQGVLCPVTLMMHLAAGVPCPPDRPPRRPCVVVAGGREPVQWESYPSHQFIHTQGQLPCCMEGGCWKSRTTPIGDNDPKDKCLCLNLVERPGLEPLAQCMDMITADDVVHRIEGYFHGGTHRYLTPEEFSAIEPHLSK